MGDSPRMALLKHAARLAWVAAGLAHAQPLDLPAWEPGRAVRLAEFAYAPAPEKIEGPRWRVPGYPRLYVPETLPALFERTLALEQLSGDGSRLEWIFTGPSGGFTIEAGRGSVRVYQRFYDSFGLRRGRPARQGKPRHPESLWSEATVEYSGSLRAIAVRLDHRLQLVVLLNGREAVRQPCLLDVTRHQVAFTPKDVAAGRARGALLAPETVRAEVSVDPAARRQAMLGFGGITSPAAYAQLSQEGRRKWWQWLREYNLLLHREYPMGARLRPDMGNWDRLADASPHYYGDNFPNGEVSDFDYLRQIRRVGGKVLFEFWQLPPWAMRGDGVPDLEAYVRAIVGYCRVSRDRAGAPPDIVGIQNELRQPPQVWQEMTRRLRRGLDDAGFAGVRIHMQDASTLAAGIDSARAFRMAPEVWEQIDYSATHMYDYQKFFHDPDAYDVLLKQWKEAVGAKPFVSTELSVNYDDFQLDSYRVALAMGQLYHKNLTLADASAILYCWLLLNVEQPSYGATRSLFVPDPAHGFVPKASGHQLRVFGAYSRRIRAGMARLEAASSDPHLLAAAFAGPRGQHTLVLLNRSLAVQTVRVRWPRARFPHAETAGPYSENAAVPAPAAGGPFEVRLEPGSLLTLGSVGPER